MVRILVVEDHETTRRTIALYLQREGWTVDTECDGLQGLATAVQSDYDLLIIDLLLPGLDGREVCRRLREQKQLPVIMLTALSTEDDLVRGLGLGANDYMTKPFSPRELVARVRARLRRTADAETDQICIAELTLDRSTKELHRGTVPVPLTATEYRLLAVLMESPGRAFSRDQLIERALGFDFEGSRKNIDIHISNLRKRIEPDRLSPQYILTVPGHGYRFRQASDNDGDS